MGLKRILFPGGGGKNKVRILRQQHYIGKDSLDENTIIRLQGLYKHYHYMSTCYHWHYRRLRRKDLAFNIFSKLLTVVGTAVAPIGGYAPLAFTAIGLIMQVYRERAGLSETVAQAKTATIAYRKLTVMIKGALSGSSYNEAMLFSEIEIVDKIVTDMCLMFPGSIERKYATRFTWGDDKAGSAIVNEAAVQEEEEEKWQAEESGIGLSRTAAASGLRNSIRRKEALRHQEELEKEELRKRKEEIRKEELRKRKEEIRKEELRKRQEEEEEEEFRGQELAGGSEKRRRRQVRVSGPPGSSRPRSISVLEDDEDEEELRSMVNIIRNRIRSNSKLSLNDTKESLANILGGNYPMKT